MIVLQVTMQVLDQYSNILGLGFRKNKKRRSARHQ